MWKDWVTCSWSIVTKGELKYKIQMRDFKACASVSCATLVDE